MKLKDIFNKKLRDEKKRMKIHSLPDYVITSEFLDLFPDKEIRNKIYAYIKNMNLDIETYNTLLQLYKSNKELAKDYINYNVLIPKEVLNFKYLPTYYVVAECINFQEKYGDIVISYLKENFDFYRQLLNNKEFIEAVGIEFALKFPDEMLQIMEYYPNVLNFECLSTVCDLLKEGKTQQYNKAVEILSLKNINDIVVELLFKNDFDKTLIQDFIEDNEFVISSLNSKLFPVCGGEINSFIDLKNKYRQLRNKYLETEYEINIAKHDLKAAKNTLYKKLFDGRSNIEHIKSYKEKSKSIKLDKMIETAVELEKCDSINELINIHNNASFDFLDCFREAENLYKYDLEELVFHPSEELGKKDEDGILIIDNSTCDLSTFTFLIHKFFKGASNQSISQKIIDNPNLWINDGIDGKKGSNTISCSLVSENKFNLFGGEEKEMILLGFDEFKDIPILSVSSQDSGTPVVSYFEVDKENNIKALNDTPSQMFSKYNSSLHNEVAIGRKGVKPTFILSMLNYKGKDFPIDDRMKKWAKEFTIPIVQIDFKVVYERARREFDELINKISQFGCTLEDYKNILKYIRTMKYYSLNLNFNLFDLFASIMDKNLSIGNVELINEILKIKDEFNSIIIEDGLPASFNVKDWEKAKIREQRKKVLFDKFILAEKRLQELYKKDSLEDPNTGFSM